MSKVLIMTNIPSPYRVDYFYYLQTHITEHEFHILYCAHNESNRCWGTTEKKLINSHFIRSKVITIKKKYDTRFIYIPQNVFKQITEINPDIVIGWEYNPTAILALIWCKLHRKKFIHLTDGTLYSERNIGKIQKITRKIIIRNCNAAIASSTKAKEKLLFWGMSSKNIFLSLLTVNIDEYSEVQHIPEKGRILYVGSMIERKGIDLLISALKYVKTDFCLHIVGNGTDEEINNIKKLAQKSNVLDSIQISGFKQGRDLIEEYQKAQIFVLPTREDCFGLVLLEAFCAGIPIISSKFADGAYDIITEKKNGILVDPFDEVLFGKEIDNALNGFYKFEKASDNTLRKFSFKAVSKGYMDAIAYVIKDSEK